MIQKIILSVLILTASLAHSKEAVSCDVDFKKEKICAQFTWIQKPTASAMPTAKDAAAFDLLLTKNGEPADLSADQSLSVSLFMPSMGHGSMPVEIKKDDTKKGVYHITRVLFSMKGDWEIRFKIKKNNKDVDTFNMPFDHK